MTVRPPNRLGLERAGFGLIRVLPCVSVVVFSPCSSVLFRGRPWSMFVRGRGRRSHAPEDMAGGRTRAGKSGRAAGLLAGRLVAKSSGHLCPARSAEQPLPAGGRQSAALAVGRESFRDLWPR